VQTWITSDIHIGHVNIIEYAHRGFADVPEMNAAIVENWNETVAPDDVVWVLGDAAMGKMTDSLPILGQMQGRKRLIPGNHDRLHPMYQHKKGYAKWDNEYREVAGFEVIRSVECRIDVGRLRGVLACHFPYEGDHTEQGERYPEWRPRDRGEWLIHGHVHDLWRQNGRMINVGMDAWGGRILPIEEIEEIIDRGIVERTERIPW
jgi:calcineurin-like phosphoesterase family protein